MRYERLDPDICSEGGSTNCKCPGIKASPAPIDFHLALRTVRQKGRILAYQSNKCLQYELQRGDIKIRKKFRFKKCHRSPVSGRSSCLGTGMISANRLHFTELPHGFSLPYRSGHQVYPTGPNKFLIGKSTLGFRASPHSLAELGKAGPNPVTEHSILPTITFQFPVLF
jgi:hypothetical protein